MPKITTHLTRHHGKVLKVRPGGRMLGLDTDDSLAIVRMVRSGFRFSRLTRFQKATSLSWEKVANCVAIPQRTLTRRQSEGRLQPDESDRLWRVSRIFDLAVDLFEGDTSAARQWLQTPQAGLGGEAPMDIANTEVGAREVENLIGRLEYGVFA
ncbi:MAG: antitoxin Xre/MbcA/ParS toxin-binding domain-containing protein [Phycisphaeraceae bacterium]